MSDFEQIRFLELLDLPGFKEFLVTRPEILAVPIGNKLPWRVYVQKHPHGRWAKKDFETYGAAFKFMKPYIRTSHDVALHCRNIMYLPPGRWLPIRRNGEPVYLLDAQGKPRLDDDGKRIRQKKFKPMQMPPGHTWCAYCRRPTIFTWFSRHHAFPPTLKIRGNVERCTICGVTATGPNDYKGR